MTRTAHAGWTKGARVRRSDHTVVELLSDGEYRPFSDGVFSGYLWHFEAKFPDGHTETIVPLAYDEIIQE